MRARAELREHALLEAIMVDCSHANSERQPERQRAVALGWAEVLGATDLFVGVNAVDYSGYPDCRPEFLEAFERLANLATAAATEGGTRFRVHAPLLQATKAGIVVRAKELGVDLGLTHTCYDPVLGTDPERAEPFVGGTQRGDRGGGITKKRWQFYLGTNIS